VKQKLLIFFSIGLMIFAIDIVFNEDSSNKVTIYESELDSLINTWVTQVGREPTNEEIDGIIKQLIDEEILYREALKLGLDKNDIIIKRRLAQKISFLKQESISRNPSEDAIRDYYNINKEDYLVESTFTFSHLYFSKDNQAQSRSIKALESIRQGEESSLFGDPFLLGKNFSIKTSRELNRSFGNQFSESIKNLEIKEWDGPISSEYGEHLVFLNSYTESFLPELDQVRSIVISDILARDQSQSTAKYLEELRKEYEIEILPDLNVQSD
tara:strand:- start:173 stop:982 length:810 start_codon:yes stop_codon:yes gene_type:complete